MPSTESEEWRYSRVGELDLEQLTPQNQPPTASATDPFDSIERAATVSVVNGWVTSVSLDEGWAAKGLQVGPSTTSADRELPVDPTVFDHLSLAFAPDGVSIQVPDGLLVEAPVVILNHHTGGGVASFSHVSVQVGANASLSIVEHQSSASGGGLAVPVVDLAVASAGRLEMVTVQDLAHDTWQLGRQHSTVADQANLSVGCASFGGAYARLRTDTNLTGRGANGDLLAVYYADGTQVHDFRTFQHHSAKDTTSDLLFKGAVDDQSNSIYTGLIHIHPDGAGSNAHQTNRNVKLSEDAWAWSVPNLEIENNDVRCSHASTVSPVDEDQQFYLHARGVPPTVSDRLIVSGFFEEVIARFSSVVVQDEVRRLVDAKLDRRGGAAS